MNALIMITLFDSGQSDRYVDTRNLSVRYRLQNVVEIQVLHRRPILNKLGTLSCV
ncbi:MAG: hypothetical protein KME05_16270 [Gloeocapsa sp. UFS-A4-WI-NPMV-4B04]|jgi:hypothetical protein|nr:hypothetical protein [Gloeocapsa sp. UFS-A4-WI-NPMV-4B04]